MTTSTPTEVDPVPLGDLRVQIYKSLRTAALIRSTGEVLSQCSLSSDEPAEHLQYRLLRDALTQRSKTSKGERALGIVHRDKLTIGTADAVIDFSLDAAATEGPLLLDGEALVHNGMPVPRAETPATALTGSKQL